MTNFENSVLKLDDLPRDENILTGRTAIGEDDNGQTRKYTIGEKLGKGGMGAVYKGIDEQGREVALKFLNCKEPKFVKALKREAKLMSEIKHPNIRQVFDFCENVCLEGNGQEPMPMLVMEYIPGQALDVTKINASNFCKYFMQMADSIEFLHSQGCIHRDIKPENFIISDDEQVKLCDFGISRIVDEHTGLIVSGLTVDGTVQKDIAGTLKYLPKNIEELKNPDKRTDLYSLGLVLYQMILGDANKFPDTRASIRAEKAAKEKNLPMPEALSELVSDLALEERSERPADIAAIKEKERDLYTAIEDEAGLPVYWTKFCEIIKNRVYPNDVAEIDTHLKNLNKDKRIEGAIALLKQTHKIRSNFPLTIGPMTLLDEAVSFFNLQNKPTAAPKNKEDAEFVIQAIKYCLENDKQIRIDHRMDYLINWENRIKEYQSKFGIDAAKELGILGKVVENEQETIFNELLKSIESKEPSNPSDIRKRISTYASRGQLTQDQAEKLNALLDKPKNTEAKNKPEYAPQSIEDIKEKYTKFADSLEGKTVTPEFKEAFAMAAYKDGIGKEYIDDVLLNTIDNVRKKSLAERIKERLGISNYKSGQNSLIFEPESWKELQVDAILNAEGLAVMDMSIDKKLKHISKLGRKYNIFVGDLIEKVISKYADNTDEPSWYETQQRLTDIAHWGQRCKVCVKPILLGKHRRFVETITELVNRDRLDESTRDTSISTAKSTQEYLHELQQKYPNAFKEAPKFEDLEKMIEREKKNKDLEKTRYLDYDDNVVGKYVGSAVGGGLLGFFSALALKSGAIGIPISVYLGAFVGLGARYCLQKYKAWKEARNTEKQKALNGALNDLDTYWSNSPNEKSLPVYEKKNKIDEKIEKKGDLSSIIAEKQPIGQYISLNQEHASPDLDEERDLMTERPKQFLKTEKNADAKAAIDALFDKATQFEKQTDEEIVGKISQIGKIARQHNLPINGVLDEISKRYELHLLAQYPNTDDTRFIKHQVNAFTGLAKAYLLENKASEVTDALTEEVDLMTEKPKPFLNLEKQVKEGRKIILLPPTQEKTLRQILEEEIQSEELKQDGKSIKQRLNEKMGSFFDKPADTNAEAVPEQMPKPLVQEAYKEPEQPAVQETYKQPEQPIPVQEEPKQILPESVPQTPLQESYQKPESPVQEEDEDDDKDERMLEQ